MELDHFSAGVLYFYFDKKPGNQDEDHSVYYTYFDWGAGFDREDAGDEVAQKYYIQFQWSHSDYFPECITSICQIMNMDL